MLTSKSRYYYTRLDAPAQRVYNGILSAWEARNRQPSFVPGLPSDVDLQKVLEFIALDNPGLFYVDFSRIVISGTASKTTIYSKFCFSDRQIANLEEQLKHAVTVIMSKLPLAAMDKYSRELALHDFLAGNISYDYGQADNTAASVIGGLLTKKAVCEGYAKTFKLLCEQAGLPCIVVTGTATPQNEPSGFHAWNIVKLNGSCAHVDVTWDSTMRTGHELCRDHFNITDEDIARDHVWERSLLPSCNSSADNWFYRNGSIVSTESELKDFIAARLIAGQKSFSVKLGMKHISQSRVMKLVGDALAQSPRLGHISSYSLRYNPMRNVAAIEFL